MIKCLTTALLAAILVACAVQPRETDRAEPVSPSEPFASTYVPPPSVTVLIDGATILTGAGERIDGGAVLIENGRISAVGRDVSAPAAG